MCVYLPKPRLRPWFAASQAWIRLRGGKKILFPLSASVYDLWLHAMINPRFSSGCFGGLSLTFCATPRAQDAAAPKSAGLQIPATDDGLPGQGPIRRYDWFRNLWASVARRGPGESKRTGTRLFYWGIRSLKDGVEDFSGWFPGMKIANRGISGDTSAWRADSSAGGRARARPAASCSSSAQTTSKRKRSPKQSRRISNSSSPSARHDAKMPIILCQVFPSSASKTRPADKIKKVNQLYADAVKGNRRSRSVETWPLFADAKGDAIAAEFPDLCTRTKRVTPNGRRVCVPFSRRWDFLRRAPYEFAPEPGFVSLFQRKGSHWLGFSPNLGGRQGICEQMAGWQRSQRARLADYYQPDEVRWSGRTAPMADYIALKMVGWS